MKFRKYFWKRSQDKENLNKKKKQHFQVWTAFTILMSLIAIIVILSWILHGLNVHVKNAQGASLPISVLGFVDIFYAPIKGFEITNITEIIIFLFCIGGFVYIVVETKAIDSFAKRITVKLKHKEIWLIPILMVFFALLGTTEGFCEESLGFYAVSVPLMLFAGFDTFTGFLIVFVGAGIGCMASTFNPFAVLIAFQNSGGVFPSTTPDITPGLVFRCISFFVLTSVAVIYVMLYARRVFKKQSASITYDTRESDMNFFVHFKKGDSDLVLTTRRKWTVFIFIFSIFLMVSYLINWDQIFHTDIFANAGKTINSKIPYITAYLPGLGHAGLDQVGIVFLIGALVVALVNWKGEATFIKEWMTGASGILSVALIIAVAGGIQFVLNSSNIQILLISELNNAIKGLNRAETLVLVFILFLPISFLIPSTSGFATAVFPIIGPVLGKNNFAGGVLAFIFASGIVNLVTPTSGVVQGATSISRINYLKFAKGIMPLILILIVVSLLIIGLGALLVPQSSNVF